MWLRLAAMAALLLAPVLPARAQTVPTTAVPPLTLDEAFARVAGVHPDLRLFGPRQDQLLAERDRASLRPAWTAGVEVENVLGSGVARGVQGAEVTLGLASVFERGGKLDARRTLAQGRIDALAVEREARRLDLLAETARRYLDAVAARELGTIAALDVGQRTRTVAAARHRLQAGASPESVVLTAQAALARAELDLARAGQRHASALQHLAALWGERAPAFEVAAQDPFALPGIGDTAALAAMLDRTPELRRFASEARLREARLQLARSESAADIDWSIGVRRLQADGDVGLVAGVSMPFGAARRAEPAIRAAEADLAALGIERESMDLALYSTLVEAHGRYRIGKAETERLAGDVLPKLARAETAAERAYRAGAISYLEWAQLQSERIAARRQRLEAALDAQRALIELQRLTGESLLAGTAISPQGNTP